jgi:hypothetical protein
MLIGAFGFMYIQNTGAMTCASNYYRLPPHCMKAIIHLFMPPPISYFVQIVVTLGKMKLDFIEKGITYPRHNGITCGMGIPNVCHHVCG